MAPPNAADLGPQAPSRALAVRDPAPPDDDLVRWVTRTGVRPGRLFGWGLALATAGALGAWLVPPLGLFGTLVFGSTFTVGGGLAFLGLRGWQRAQASASAPIPAPLSPSRRRLFEERARRLAPVLSEGSATFGTLMRTLRWTELALVETLTYMRDSGRLVEDLDLESGEWVYRLADPDVGGRAGLTLADRRVRLGLDAPREDAE